MASALNFRDVFLCLETFEKCLNIAGYIPYVGTCSAVVRILYARIEVAAGVAFAALALGLRVLSNSGNSGACFIFGATLFVHGTLNEIRAYAEGRPGVALITTLPYDIFAAVIVGRRFFSYL